MHEDHGIPSVVITYEGYGVLLLYDEGDYRGK